MRTVELTYAISGLKFTANPEQFVTASVPLKFDASNPTTYIEWSSGTNCLVLGNLDTVTKKLRGFWFEQKPKADKPPKKSSTSKAKTEAKSEDKPKDDA